MHGQEEEHTPWLHTVGMPCGTPWFGETGTIPSDFSVIYSPKTSEPDRLLQGRDARTLDRAGELSR